MGGKWGEPWNAKEINYKREKALMLNGEKKWNAQLRFFVGNTLAFAFLCSCLATDAAGLRVQQRVCCLADVLFKDTNVDGFIASCITVLAAAKEILTLTPDVGGVSAGFDQRTRPVWSSEQQNNLLLVVVTWPLETRQRQEFKTKES